MPNPPLHLMPWVFTHGSGSQGCHRMVQGGRVQRHARGVRRLCRDGSVGKTVVGYAAVAKAYPCSHTLKQRDLCCPGHRIRRCTRSCGVARMVVCSAGAHMIHRSGQEGWEPACLDLNPSMALSAHRTAKPRRKTWSECWPQHLLQSERLKHCMPPHTRGLCNKAIS